MKERLESHTLLSPLRDVDVAMLRSIVLASDLASNSTGMLAPLRSLLQALLQYALGDLDEESRQKVSCLVGACMKAISGLLTYTPNATDMDSGTTTVMMDALSRFPDNAAVLSAFDCFLAVLIQ